MKKFLGISAIMLLAVFMAQTAGAAIIDYKLYDLGDGLWQYDYTITNDSNAYTIDMFDLYFYNVKNYDNFQLVDAEPNGNDFIGWEGYAMPPDVQYPYWWLTWMVYEPNLVLAFDESIDVSIIFSWDGVGVPGGHQGYAMYDLAQNGWDFDSPFESSHPSVIPEPQTFMLLGTGILGLAAYCRARKTKR